ncbi:hypothetical protein [Rubritalea tangerina]
MKKLLLTSAMGMVAFSGVRAKDAECVTDGKTGLLDQNFVTLSGGYLKGFEQPYMAVKLGSEVGQCGNIYLQVLGLTDDEFYADGIPEISEDVQLITFGGGYTHYVPVSDDGAFFAGASMGVAYNSYDAAFQGLDLLKLEGNSFYADGNIGYEHFLTDNLILSVSGKLLWVGDYSDGSTINEEGLPAHWKFEHKDIYYGVEAGLTFIF